MVRKRFPSWARGLRHGGARSAFINAFATNSAKLAILLPALSGCGNPDPPTASIARPATSFASQIEIQLDHPAADEVFKAGADVEVSGEVVTPAGGPVPDVVTVQFLQGQLNAGSFAAPMKRTAEEHVYSFAHSVKAPREAGAYAVRAEAVIASELSNPEAPAVSRKRKKPASEPGRAWSQEVRIRVVADDAR